MLTLIRQHIRRSWKTIVRIYDFILDTHYYWRVRRYRLGYAIELARKTFNY